MQSEEKKFEKGLIEEIKIENLNDEKVKIKPEDIKHMYLPPSGLDKLSKKVSFMSDATLWDQDELNGDLFGQGLRLLRAVTSTH